MRYIKCAYKSKPKAADVGYEQRWELNRTQSYGSKAITWPRSWVFSIHCDRPTCTCMISYSYFEMSKYVTLLFVKSTLTKFCTPQLPTAVLLSLTVCYVRSFLRYYYTILCDIPILCIVILFNFGIFMYYNIHKYNTTIYGIAMLFRKQRHQSL